MSECDRLFLFTYELNQNVPIKKEAHEVHEDQRSDGGQLANKIFILQAEQEKVADAKLAEKCGDMSDIPKIRLLTKKTLKGHINKVNSVHYSGDSRYVSNSFLTCSLIPHTNFHRNFHPLKGWFPR